MTVRRQLVPVLIAALVAALSLLPPYAVKIVGRTLKPPSYRKVQGV